MEFLLRAVSVFKKEKTVLTESAGILLPSHSLLAFLLEVDVLRLHGLV